MNFVLALPYEPELLEGATLPAATRPRPTPSHDQVAGPSAASDPGLEARVAADPSTRIAASDRARRRERFRALLELLDLCSPWPRSSASACFVYAPFAPDWWLPNAAGDHHHVVSTFGREIDSLFVIILWITGIVFIGTQIVLVWAAWRFVDRPGAGRRRPVLPRQPAAGGDLDDHPGGDPGLHRPLPDGDLGRASSSAAPRPRSQPLAEVTGRQFQWVMRYPGPDGKLNTARRPVHGQRPALRQGHRRP